MLIAAIADAMSARGLTQVQAARLCHTDQPTLSKVLRGRTESVTLDKLLGWLLLLGRSVEIRISGTDPNLGGTLTTVVDERAR
jgi:predicted XRE-type DNA-binding protein